MGVAGVGEGGSSPRVSATGVASGVGGVEGGMRLQRRVEVIIFYRTGCKGKVLSAIMRGENPLFSL